jgi:hypothetical protein
MSSSTENTQVTPHAAALNRLRAILVIDVISIPGGIFFPRNDDSNAGAR